MGWLFGWGMGLVMLFGWLLPLAAVGLIVWLIVGRGHGDAGGNALGDRHGGDSDTALQLLRERYARGEISREEFLQTREDLGQSVPADDSTKG